MRLLCSLCFVACVALLLGTPARAATRVNCPRTLLFESTNGTYYVTVFGAPVLMRASFDLTLYTKSAAYSLTVPQAAIAVPVNAPHAAFRGMPVVIRNPGADPFLGVTVAPTVANATAPCDGEDLIVPSAESLTSPDRHVDPQAAALEDQVAVEAPKSGAPLTPTSTRPPKSITCLIPFTDATVDVLDRPAYPADGAFGTVSVRVDLDERANVTGTTVVESSGNSELEAAAVASARKTTFHPAIFACEAQKSSHVLDFDFSK
jgi:TonB family protein